MKKNIFLENDILKIIRKLEFQIKKYFIAIFITIIAIIISLLFLFGVFTINDIVEKIVFLFFLPLLSGLLSSFILAVLLIVWNKDKVEFRYQELIDIQKSEGISHPLKSHYDFDRLNIYTIIDKIDFSDDQTDSSNEMIDSQNEIIQEILTSRKLIIINPLVTPLVENIHKRREKNNLKTDLITSKTARGSQGGDVLKKHFFYKQIMANGTNLSQEFYSNEVYENFSLNFSMVTDKFIIYSFFPNSHEPNSHKQSHDFPLIVMFKDKTNYEK